MSRSVMVVMRHAPERLLYGDVLDQGGFSTTRMSSISAARDHMRANAPDVVILGLDDTSEDTLAFVRWVKDARPTRVVGVTASPIAARTATGAGCDECLEMPIPLAAIVSAVGRRG